MINTPIKANLTFITLCYALKVRLENKSEENALSCNGIPLLCTETRKYVISSPYVFKMGVLERIFVHIKFYFY